MASASRRLARSRCAKGGFSLYMHEGRGGAVALWHNSCGEGKMKREENQADCMDVQNIVKDVKTIKMMILRARYTAAFH